MSKAKEETPDTPTQETSGRLVPAYNWHSHWLTVTEFSRMMGRQPDTVYGWVRNGTLAEFGIPVWHFRQGRRHSGRTFIMNIY